MINAIGDFVTWRMALAVVMFGLAIWLVPGKK